MAEVRIQLDWSAGTDTPARPANLVLVQSLRDEYVLTFGHAPPPIEGAMHEDAMDDYLEKNPVKVQQITRLTLPTFTASILVEALGQLLRAREEDGAGSSGQGETG